MKNFKKFAMREEEQKGQSHLMRSPRLLRSLAMTKGLALVTLVTLITSSSYASGAGTTGAQFLRIPVGARAAGMANAFSALADDITAVYWNPAGLTQLQMKELSVSYNAYFVDTSAQFIGYGQKLGPGHLGASLNMLSVKDIEKRSVTGGDANTPDLGTFKTQDMAGSLAYAHQLDLSGHNLSLGAALKYISSDLGDTTGVGLSYGNVTAKADTFALDLGALMPLGQPDSFKGGSLQASLAVLNLGGELKFKDEGDPLPLDIKPGLAWKGKLNNRPLNAVLDSDILVNDSLTLVNLGFEYWFIEQMAFRTGYQLKEDNPAPGFALGLGFKHTNLSVDYAFVPFGNLGDTHRVSLGYRF